MDWSRTLSNLAGGDFEAWCQEEIRPIVQPTVTTVMEEVEVVLAGLRSEAQAEEGLERDRWSVFGEHAEKSAGSVLRKLAGDLEREAAALDSTEALRARVLALGDLGRFRVVCGLPRDVARARAPLLGLGGASDDVKDFVRDTKLRKALAGHRAVQFTIRRQGVGVEIQIMTLLQHTWDRRNHCFYEWLREGRMDEALDLRIDDHAVAEALHVADRMADTNFGAFLLLRSGG